VGMGVWGLGIGPNPQSPIPNPPIPNPHKKRFSLIFILKFYKLINIIFYNIYILKNQKLNNLLFIDGNPNLFNIDSVFLSCSFFIV